MKHIVAIGQRFGRLKVLYLDETPRKTTTNYYICRCDCGKEKSVSKPMLYTGGTQSCGCLRSELLSKKNMSHGLSGTPTYISWQSMLTRCKNSSFHKYERYGKRGIKVCERWNKFENFLEHMGIRPDGTTLDRLDVNGDYEPSNCRWATNQEQARNKTTTYWISAFDKTLCLMEWSELTGINRNTIVERLKSGMDPEEALTP